MSYTIYNYICIAVAAIRGEKTCITETEFERFKRERQSDAAIVNVS